MECLNNSSKNVPVEFKTQVSTSSTGKQVKVLWFNGLKNNSQRIRIFSENYDLESFDFTCVKNFAVRAFIKFGIEAIKLIVQSKDFKFTDSELKELKAIK